MFVLFNLDFDFFHQKKNYLVPISFFQKKDKNGFTHICEMWLSGSKVCAKFSCHKG